MAEKQEGLATRTIGEKVEEEQLSMNQMRTLSGLINRLQLASLAGKQFGGKRDLYEVFGYEKSPTTDQYLAKYSRQDIASRIIDAPPGATWSNPPIVTDNDTFDTAWQELVKSVKLWGALYRADRLSRLNPFSILLFGFDDGASLETPLRAKVSNLLYVRAMGSRQVDELTFNSDTQSPRFGLPELYSIKFDDPATKSSSSGTVIVKGIKDIKVHWSRIVHIVENPLEDTVFGIPIMEKVFNLLDDLLKVSGGTAEMFWLSGRGGLQADIDKEMDVDPADAAALADEIDEFMHQLRRFIKTRGVTLKPLEHAVPSPKDVFEVIMALISGTTGIPRRILLGSEAGQLASEQDRANWAERITERRRLFAHPDILVPTVELLQNVTLLPAGDIEWDWPSAFIQNPLEEGQTMAQIARAAGNLSRQTGSSTPMQLLSEEENRGVLGFKGTIPDNERFVPPTQDSAQDLDTPTREEIKKKIEEEEEDE